eukprot:303004_1
MDVAKRLSDHIQSIDWSLRLKLSGICFGCILYQVISFKAPAKEDKIADKDAFMDGASGGATKQKSRVPFILIGVGIHSTIWYRFYRKYLRLNDDEKQASLTTIEKVGFSLAMSGFLVRELAKYYLGRHFTYVVSIQNNHKVIDYGLYGIVRHPGYTGLIIQQIGNTIWTQSIFCGFISLLSTHQFIAQRIPDEEAFLTDESQNSQLAKSYKEYKTRVTKKIIPFLY